MGKKAMIKYKRTIISDIAVGMALLGCVAVPITWVASDAFRAIIANSQIVSAAFVVPGMFLFFINSIMLDANKEFSKEFKSCAFKFAIYVGIGGLYLYLFYYDRPDTFNAWRQYYTELFIMDGYADILWIGYLIGFFSFITVAILLMMGRRYILAFVAMGILAFWVEEAVGAGFNGYEFQTLFFKYHFYGVDPKGEWGVLKGIFYTIMMFWLLPVYLIYYVIETAVVIALFLAVLVIAGFLFGGDDRRYTSSEVEAAREDGRREGRGGW